MNAQEAFDNAKSNSNRSTLKYYSSFDNFADISLTPKFFFDKKTKFFTIGSCFARNIESYFVKNNIPFLSKVPSVEGEYFKTGGAKRSGYQNVYTPASVLEVSRLVFKEDPYHSIVEHNELHYDLLTHGLVGLPKEEALTIRKGLIEAYQKLAETDVVIITLGFIEVWKYTIANAWVNQSPAEPKLRKLADDFEFFVFDEQKTYDVLVESIKNFKSINPNMKFIFTVSPVPLTSTLTRDHILIANQRSKSVLHCVAQRLHREFEEVDYFPSYEMVSLSERKYAFKDDNIHVTAEVVANVMDRFFRDYFA